MTGIADGPGGSLLPDGGAGSRVGAPVLDGSTSTGCSTALAATGRAGGAAGAGGTAASAGPLLLGTGVGGPTFSSTPTGGVGDGLDGRVLLAGAELLPSAGGEGRLVRRLVTGGAPVSTTGIDASASGWAGGATIGLSAGRLAGAERLACSGAPPLLGSGFPTGGAGAAASGVLTGGGGAFTLTGGGSSAGRLTPSGGAASGSKFASSLSALDAGATVPSGAACGVDGGVPGPACPASRGVPFPDGLGGAGLAGVPGRMPASMSRRRMAVCRLRCSVDRWP
jgi:hypothetical protein